MPTYFKRDLTLNVMIPLSWSFGLLLNSNRLIGQADCLKDPIQKVPVTHEDKL